MVENLFWLWLITSCLVTFLWAGAIYQRAKFSTFPLDIGYRQADLSAKLAFGMLLILECLPLPQELPLVAVLATGTVAFGLISGLIGNLGRY